MVMIILFYDKNNAGGKVECAKSSNRKIDNIQVDINIIELILDIYK